MLHAVAYAGLMAVAWLAFGTVLRRSLLVILAGFLLTSGYGVLDEWHQSFVPTRNAEFYDWVADTIGAALMGTIFLLRERIRRVSHISASRT